jgi:ethanolamine transporter EutH
VVLPFYRALERQPESAATIVAYADGHFFQAPREAMASDIRVWLMRELPR